MILKTPIWLVHLAANQSSVMSIPNLHLKLLSTQGTGADKLLSTPLIHPQSPSRYCNYLFKYILCDSFFVNV